MSDKQTWGTLAMYDETLFWILVVVITPILATAVSLIMLLIAKEISSKICVWLIMLLGSTLVGVASGFGVGILVHLIFFPYANIVVEPFIFAFWQLFACPTAGIIIAVQILSKRIVDQR